MNTHTYLTWDEQTVSPSDDAAVDAAYQDGYVYTRKAPGALQQTRSLRIRLADFELSSENRRILRKAEDIELKAAPLPMPDYHWQIGKLAKDFYSEKFGDGTFSANKVRELLTSEDSNFNTLLTFGNDETLGYTICHKTDTLLHYSYPFYDLDQSPKSMGLAMMTKAIVWAKEQGLEYVYLGSFQRPSDTYKLQFKGMEWFDGERWQSDLEGLKEIL